MEKKNILVFDVESTSLHGKAFAVGAVVIEASTGREVDQFLLKSRESEKDANDWVKENVLPHLGNIPSVETDRELRDKFWEFYCKHIKGSYIWADVAYPVETNFLEQLHHDNPSQREFEMPYPLYDVANHLDVNIDRTDFSELTGAVKHDPYWDAKTSAFSLLRVIGSMEQDMGRKSNFWEKVKKSSWERFRE